MSTYKPKWDDLQNLMCTFKPQWDDNFQNLTIQLTGDEGSYLPNRHTNSFMCFINCLYCFDT